MSEIIKSLSKIQKELKAPKNQKNTFGNYNYRSCEDILEAVKPYLAEDEIIMLSDTLEYIGNRYYVKATATFRKGEEEISVSAYAREAEVQKGMSDAQITGGAGSYGRKYALNGLFLIDDAKDDDSNEHTNNANSRPGQKAPAKPISNTPVLSPYQRVEKAIKNSKTVDNLMKIIALMKTDKNLTEIEVNKLTELSIAQEKLINAPKA